MSDRPEVGDRVSLFVPGNWRRSGTVVETDYHPAGVDDAVRIRFDGEPAAGGCEWWDARWVRKEQGP